MALVGGPVSPRPYQDDLLTEFVLPSLWGDDIMSGDFNFDDPLHYSDSTSLPQPDTAARSAIAAPTHSDSSWTGHNNGLQQPMPNDMMMGQSPSTSPQSLSTTDTSAFTPTSSQEQDQAAQNSSEVSNGELDHDQGISPHSLASSYVFPSPHLSSVTHSSDDVIQPNRNWTQPQSFANPTDFDLRYVSGTSSIASSMRGQAGEDQWSFVSFAAPPVSYDHLQPSDDNLSDGYRSAGDRSNSNQILAPMPAAYALDVTSDLELSDGQGYTAGLPHDQPHQFLSYPQTFHHEWPSPGHYTPHQHTHFDTTNPPQVPSHYVQELDVGTSSGHFLQSQPRPNVQPLSAIPAAPLHATRLDNDSSRIAADIASQRLPSSVQRRHRGHHVPSAEQASRARARDRTLQPRQHAPRHAADNAESPQRGIVVRGGRKKGKPLSDDQRKQSADTRKKGGCWRCGLQRDQCPGGDECLRCITARDKKLPYYFPCDRSKLPDFIHDILPPSMTVMHQKQTIEDTVKDQVAQWDPNWVEVYLTSGYGPPLRWKLHEFMPRTGDLLGQLQYLQNPDTRQLQSFHKYSPPLGLMKLDASDDDHLEAHLSELLQRQYLVDFGWTCFEEESQVDPDQFQAKMLVMMCTLFHDTRDSKLRELLGDVVRMMVITYIMGHTLTITEETLPMVLDHIKYTPPGIPKPHTSPRLANRQLKFYYAVMRTNIYEHILNWQQQTLKSSKKKEDSWLPSFCAMLGFAMVLEEVQRTIQIQADAKIMKNEMPADQATKEAANACERIDQRFTLLVNLFQFKYRDKIWGDNGSFGPGTPTFTDPAAREFLANVRELLLQKFGHLQEREKVAFAKENQCLYTSRLVARFLLPFLKLPRM